MLSAAQAIRRWATAARLGPTGELGSAALGLAVTWGYLGQVPCPLPRLCRPGSKRGSSSAGSSFPRYLFAASLGLNASCWFGWQRSCPVGDSGLQQQLCSLKLHSPGAPLLWGTSCALRHPCKLALRPPGSAPLFGDPSLMLFHLLVLPFRRKLPSTIRSARRPMRDPRMKRSCTSSTGWTHPGLVSR